MSRRYVMVTAIAAFVSSLTVGLAATVIGWELGREMLYTPMGATA